MKLLRPLLIVSLFLSICTFGQVSPDCATAIPICSNTPINGGTNGFAAEDFNGAAESGCLERTTSGSIESNSAWYRFRTNASGELGFNIGHNSGEDWDFALYLATDCTVLGDPIRCNFFDNDDESRFIGLGEDPTGDSANVQYEDYIMVEPGQDYYLFINNFSNVNSGFSIQFSGQLFVDNPNDALDCSIISNLLGAPIAACSNTPVVLDATTTTALSYRWFQDIGSGFVELMGEVLETLTVTEDAIYRVEVVTGTGNIISDVQVAFSEAPMSFPVEDESFCQSLLGYNFERKSEEVIGAQDPETVLVNYFVTQQDADLNTNPLPEGYIPPIGDQRLYIRVSSADNPECFDASQNFLLTTIAPPELGEDDEIRLCDGELSVLIGEETANPEYTYSWSTGEITPAITVTEEGTYVLTARTMVNNTFCVRTRTFTVIESAVPVISGVEIADFSYSNTVRVRTNVVGDFEYRLDDGAYQESPVFEGVLPGNHVVYMRDINGCGVDTQDIAVVGYIPFFTPNGDGVNEDWHLLGLEFLEDPQVNIFDRFGKLIVQLTEESDGWDGTYNGVQLPGTDYWFKLSFLDENGTRVEAQFLQNNFSLRR